MKLALVLILTAVIAFPLFSQNGAGKFDFSGKITGAKRDYIYIEYFKNLNEKIIDSCLLENGHFQFIGYIDGTRKLNFYQKNKSKQIDESNWAEIFIEPGSITALFKQDEFKKGEIQGSRPQNEFSIYLKRLDSLQEKWKLVFEEWDHAKLQKDTFTLDKIRNELFPLYNEDVKSIQRKYVLEFPYSDISPFLFAFDRSLNQDSIKYYFSLLTSSVQNSFFGKIIGTSIIKQEKLKVGQLAPAFTKVDVNGNLVSLKKFEGRYVLLEFWASWCVPCREESPYLKKAYKKYHTRGFEIIAFSLDRLEDKDEWITAIKNDSLPWVQICDFKEWTGDVVQDFDLAGRGIPANFLINPKGEIIAKNLRGDELEIKLSELMN